MGTQVADIPDNEVDFHIPDEEVEVKKSAATPPTGYGAAVKSALPGLFASPGASREELAGVAGPMAALEGKPAVAAPDRSWGLGERLKHGWDAGGSDIRGKLGTSIAYGLGPFVGMDPQAAEEKAARGDTAGIYGQATVPAALAIAGPALDPVAKGISKGAEVVGQAGSNVRSAVGRAVRDPATGRVKTPYELAVEKVLPDPYAPNATPAKTIPRGTNYGQYLENQKIAARSAKAVKAPEPPLGSPENPGFHSKLPTRMPKQVAQESPVASPFAGMTPSSAPAGNVPLPEIGGQSAPAAQVPGITPTAAPSPVAAPTLEASKANVVRLPEPRDPLPGENPNYNASIPRARLLDLGRQGRPGAGDQLRNIGKTVLYVPPEGYPGPRPEVAPPTMQTAGEGSPVAPPSYAYRAHDVGNPGMDLERSHAHATTDLEQAQRYAGSRNPGTPQTVSKTDLSGLKEGHDFIRLAGPDGSTWIRFRGQANWVPLQ